MRLYLGTRVARCPICRGTDWRVQDPGKPFTVLSPIACTKCGQVETYADLALKIPESDEPQEPGG